MFWSSEIILTPERGRRDHESNLQKEHRAGRKAQQSTRAMLLEAAASPRFQGANGKGKKVDIRDFDSQKQNTECQAALGTCETIILLIVPSLQMHEKDT